MPTDSALNGTPTGGTLGAAATTPDQVTRPVAASIGGEPLVEVEREDGLTDGDRRRPERLVAAAERPSGRGRERVVGDEPLERGEDRQEAVERRRGGAVVRVAARGAVGGVEHLARPGSLPDVEVAAGEG